MSDNMSNNHITFFMCSKDSSCSNLMSSSVYGQTQINNDVETILLDIIRENKIEVLQELPKDTACTNQLLKVA